MAKIVNISEIHPTLGFTEFDILEKYRKSFNESELGKLHSVFPFACMANAAGLSDRRLGRRNRFKMCIRDRGIRWPKGYPGNRPLCPSP